MGDRILCSPSISRIECQFYEKQERDKPRMRTTGAFTASTEILGLLECPFCAGKQRYGTRWTRRCDGGYPALDNTSCPRFQKVYGQTALQPAKLYQRAGGLHRTLASALSGPFNNEHLQRILDTVTLPREMPRRELLTAWSFYWNEPMSAFESLEAQTDVKVPYEYPIARSSNEPADAY